MKKSTNNNGGIERAREFLNVNDIIRLLPVNYGMVVIDRGEKLVVYEQNWNIENPDEMNTLECNFIGAERLHPGRVFLLIKKGDGIIYTQKPDFPKQEEENEDTFNQIWMNMIKKRLGLAEEAILRPG